MTVYHVESIGSVFKDRDLPGLAKQFNARASEGFIFQSVFHVTQPGGCFGFARPVGTYLAIYKKETDD